jgi:hypothetical protein
MLWLSRGGVPSLDRSRALIGLAVVFLSCDVEVVSSQRRVSVREVVIIIYKIIIYEYEVSSS